MLFNPVFLNLLDHRIFFPISWKSVLWNAIQDSTKAYIVCLTVYHRGSAVKNLPTMQETWVQSLGWKDSLEEGITTHLSILAWEIPWAENLVGYSPWGRRVRHNWSDWACTHTVYHLFWGEVCQELCQGSCSQTRNMKSKRDTEERGPLKVTESKERYQSTQTRGKGVPGKGQPSWLCKPSCAVLSRPVMSNSLWPHGL